MFLKSILIKTRSLIPIIPFLIYCSVYSQSAIIIDVESGVPLQDVNIFNFSGGTTSDESGNFYFG